MNGNETKIPRKIATLILAVNASIGEKKYADSSCAFWIIKPKTFFEKEKAITETTPIQAIE